MLRLRAYEKLQNLVQAGIVKKVGKEYKGVPAALATFMETAAELNANFANGVHSRPPNAPEVSSSKATITSAEGAEPKKGKTPVKKAPKAKPAPEKRKAVAQAR